MAPRPVRCEPDGRQSVLVEDESERDLGDLTGSYLLNMLLNGRPQPEPVPIPAARLGGKFPCARAMSQDAQGVLGVSGTA